MSKLKSLSIGEFTVRPIKTGIFKLDGGAMFGTVPKVLWEKHQPPDSKNRIDMEARALLLDGPNRKVLIDCGVGQDFVDKYGEKLGQRFADIYAVQSGGDSLEKSLREVGLSFEDITDVILTHLHFDHCGGGVKSIDGELKPAFPHAKYYIQKANLENAQKPNLREKASYFTANFEPLARHGVLKTLEGDIQDLLPGISVYVSHGHTHGQQVVKICDAQTTVFYCGDLVPTSTHIRLPWLMGYDLNPLLLMEEKKRFLSMASDEGWFLFFEHDPLIDFSRVARDGHDFKLMPFDSPAAL